jgi:hypothetical protein
MRWWINTSARNRRRIDVIRWKVIRWKVIRWIRIIIGWISTGWRIWTVGNGSWNW